MTLVHQHRTNSCRDALSLFALLFVGFLLHPAIRSFSADPFPTPKNTQEVKDRLLTPEEALRSLRLPKGFQASLIASEPEVQQPIGFTTDERGRIWVAECYTYAESKTNFSDEHRDRIVILEDTDGDGKSDVRKVFWDQAKKLTSVEVGFGGVWALCAPHLLFIPDKNRDDVPDSEPIVVLDGWDGGVVRHNIVNGLKWGPDGWLYGRHGILATSIVGKPGTSESQRTRVNCGVWRYHPISQAFEMVANGTTNPWGFDYDEHGEMFMINTVIGHLWHVVPGAHFRRMYGVDANRFTYQLMEQSADHFHWDTGEAWNDIRKGVSDSTSKAGGGHAHSGLMIYLGDNWPNEYRNSLFTLNLHGRRVNHDTLDRRGAGYVARHADDLVHVDDQWFRGLELIYGPDGGVFILDWSDIGECHENDGVHRTSGRIYKITYGPSRASKNRDWQNASEDELVGLHSHNNDWYSRLARRLLQERAVSGASLKSAESSLQKLLETGTTTQRLRAMWSLHSMQRLTDAKLTTLLNDKDEHIRAWSVRLLVERQPISAPTVKAFESIAAAEKSGLVLLYVASALQQLPTEKRWNIADGLVSHGEFANDPQLPLMVWYGIESAVAKNSSRAVAVARTSRLPLVRKFIARRLAEEIESDPTATDQLLNSSFANDDKQVQLDTLQGIHEALRGWQRAAVPTAWKRVTSTVDARGTKEMKTMVRDLSLVFGDGRAVQDLIDIVNDSKADLDSRRIALRSLATQKDSKLLPLFKKSMTNRDLMADALRGLANFSEPEIAKLILDQFSRLTPEARQDAVNVLASRESFAFALLDAIDTGRVKRQELSAFHARQIQSIGSASLSKKLSEAWGDVRGTNEEKEKVIQQVRNLMTSKSSQANLPEGRLVFQKACASCHVLYGVGRKVGPDLTGANRQNLAYLLENIIDPSATVAADFRSTILVLKDGRVLTGVVGDQTPKTVDVLMQKETHTVNRSEIEEMKATGLSLMPDGLLSNLSQVEIVNLFGYLMSSSQVESAPESNAAANQKR